jgi:uncharacterized membrane protein
LHTGTPGYDVAETRETHGRRAFSVFLTLAAVIMTIFLVDTVGYVFLGLGIPVWLVLVIIPGSLIGSFLNIRITTIESDPSDCIHEYVTVWGVPYKVYAPDCPGKTELSINFGGAIIPCLVSTYLLAQNLGLVVPSLVATVVVMLFVNRIARVEPEVGIITPALLPPLVAGLTAGILATIFVGIVNPYVIAYTSGTIGTLVGADILNIRNLGKLRSGKASIGGAGTWDGIFLTGILAVLFT